MELDALRQAIDPVNPWWHGRKYHSGEPREVLGEIVKWVDRGLDHQILVIRGMRRAGKTFLLRQLVGQLLSAGVAPKAVVYANLEHDVFAGRPGQAELDQLLALALSQCAPDRPPVLLLDEIQAATNWTRWALRVLETGQARLAVSGSTSQLMPEDVAPLLTGRRRDVTVWPLSFREQLRFLGYDDLGDGSDAPALPPEVAHHLDAYLQNGGLPYPWQMRLSDEERHRYLAAVFDDILLRDVTFHAEVRRVRALDRLARLYLRNSGSEMSKHKLKTKHGFAIDQARDYTNYLERAWLIGVVPRLTFRTGHRENEPTGKVYAIDTGLRNAVTFRHSPDLGHVAETAVYAELLRDRRPQVRVFHHLGRRGCDFVVWRGEDADRLVQVWFDNADPMPERELAGLVEAAEAVRLPAGAPAEIVTNGPEWERHLDGGLRVRAVCLARWLLERAHERQR